jgi:hypothetical protein
MGSVVIDMSMSLDGYIAAPDDKAEQELGEDGMRLQLGVRGSLRSRRGVARAHWATCRALRSPTSRP